MEMNIEKEDMKNNMRRCDVEDAILKFIKDFRLEITGVKVKEIKRQAK